MLTVCSRGVIGSGHVNIKKISFQIKMKRSHSESSFGSSNSSVVSVDHDFHILERARPLAFQVAQLVQQINDDPEMLEWSQSLVQTINSALTDPFLDHEGLEVTMIDLEDLISLMMTQINSIDILDDARQQRYDPVMTIIVKLFDLTDEGNTYSSDLE